MAKAVIEVPVAVDESSMGSRGWNVLDARARVTHDGWHTLSISVRLEFDRNNWTSRYKGDDWVSPVLVEISSPTLGETRFVDLTLFDPKQLRGGKASELVSGDIAYDMSSVNAEDIDIKLVSVDAADVPNRIYPLERVARGLPLEVVDDTSEPEASNLELTGNAFVTAGDDGGGVVVVLSGETTVAPYVRLVEISAQREEREPDGTFDYVLPDVEIDVLDATDFLLGRSSVYLGLEVQGEGPTDLPSRPARWVIYTELDEHELAGDPSKVIVRLVDADY